MKYCSQCGGQLPDEARFCNKCGSAVSNQEDNAPEIDKETLPAPPGPSKSGNKETGYEPERTIQSIKQRKGFPGVAKSTMFIVIIAALILAAGGFWGWRSMGSEARVQEKLDLAVKYLSENKYEEAVLAYNDVIKIEPREVKAYQGLAKTYTMQGKYDEAKSTYERGMAAVSTKNKPGLRIGLAGMYMDKGDLQEAEHYYQTIINENKSYIDAYRGLALVYQEQGNKDKARAILDQGIKDNNSDYSAYNALARFYVDSGDKDKVLANIVKSLDLEMNQQEAYVLLTDLYKGKLSELVDKADSVAGTKTAAMLKFYAYYSDKKYTEALTQYKSGLEQDPGCHKARVLATICMFNSGDKAGAEPLIKQLTGKKVNTWIMSDIARYYQLAGDKNSVVTWVNKSLSANEQNIDAVKLLVEIYNKENPELAKIANTKFIIYVWQPVKYSKKAVSVKGSEGEKEDHWGDGEDININDSRLSAEMKQIMALMPDAEVEAFYDDGILSKMWLLWRDEKSDTFSQSDIWLFDYKGTRRESYHRFRITIWHPNEYSNAQMRKILGVITPGSVEAIISHMKSLENYKEETLYYEGKSIYIHNTKFNMHLQIKENVGQ